MAEEAATLDLKRIIGAMIFGSEHSLTVKEIRKCLQEVAQADDGSAGSYGNIKESEVLAAIEEMKKSYEGLRQGFLLGEVAGGLRFHSDPACGKWLKHLLDVGKPNRLSRPALETLAIIAYRQPATRGEIEAVRGVNVDHIVRMLMEMQLVKIAGRSELPGKPFQYGTTQAFLEHFGLKDLNELKSLDPALLAAREKDFKKPAKKESGAHAAATEPVAGDEAATKRVGGEPDGAQQ